MSKLNAIDRLVSFFSPTAGVRRQQARTILSYYEAAKPSNLRKGRREANTGNVAVGRAGTSLREQVRHLEQNHDLVLGAINALVNNIVGPAGIGIEPQPRSLDGEIHDAFAQRLAELYKDWCKLPEVTREHDFASAQRLACRTWVRDGEVLAQLVEGISPVIQHGSSVPLSIELMEPDHVPLQMTALDTQYVVNGNNVVHGIEINGWGKPVAFWVYKEHPGDYPVYAKGPALKRVSADRMLKLANITRIRQLRGVSAFAAVIERLEDLKDYEESERVAAKVAASMAAYIKKGGADIYTPPESANEPQRSIRFQAGMVFDDLKPGEEIGTIDTNRPNPNLETYRSGQLRAAASAIGLTYSTMSRNYNGTYSAQRQELVEGWSSYAVLSDEFAKKFVRPIYERFIDMAIASGQLRVPMDVDMETVYDCLFIAPQMPWIDPEKEAKANAVMEDRAYMSGPEIIRKRCGNPRDVIDQQSRWLRLKESRGIPAPQPSGSAPGSNGQQNNDPANPPQD